MNSPLADRIRPKDLSLVVGQQHLLASGKVLRRIIESGEISNLIFYGPSGVGKTTVANIIAQKTGKKLFKLNATTASTADLKDIILKRDSLECQNGILLYLDEIQYFNKKQQQILLEYIENGDLTLIASTTENPFFYVYGAILSRANVFEFKLLEPKDIEEFLLYACKFLGQEQNLEITILNDALKLLGQRANGDLRSALNTLELAVLSLKNGQAPVEINYSTIDELTKSSGGRYDRDGDSHYDIISAYQKSMRGSDPDAALHYLARLLNAGDLPSATRRLMVCACEDVGLAYPQIIPIVKAAVDMALMLGLPEARIPLADAVVLVAISPKSNSAYNAINSAMADVAAGKAGAIPRQLQNKHFDGEDAKIKGQNYLYPHNYKNHYVKQQYLPNELKNTTYYQFGNNKTENSFKEYINRIKNEKD